MAEAALLRKLDRMKDILRSLDRVTVAFSAGVDSTFVLKVAFDALGPANVVAVTGRSPSVAATELEEAGRLAASIGVRHLVIDSGEFDDPNYLANPTDRCYFCKTALFEKMQQIVSDRGLGAIVTGTNADDLGDYRPGISAARERSVRQPCAEAGLTKSEIRILSGEMGLPTFDKPASPCLASRVQYGESITPQKLKMVERAEVVLRTLLESLDHQPSAFSHQPSADAGSHRPDCRVRFHDKLARIEVPSAYIERLAEPETRARLDAALREIGFHYVTLDLRGYRTGSLNEVIAFGERQRGQ